MSVRIEVLGGVLLRDHLEGLARLRIEVFRDWPYLYDGSMAYEAEYLRGFSRQPGAVIVAAFDGDALIGESTAAPLLGQAGYVTAPFTASGLPLERFFYFGESVLLPQYRGQGIGVAFFAEREAAARRYGGIETCVFCAVQRASDDPRKPMGATSLEPFWARRGYRRWDGMMCSIVWQEIGGEGEIANNMQFWRKDLHA